MQDFALFILSSLVLRARWACLALKPQLEC